MILEAVVVLLLISALTPVLYKHISERRQEVYHINDANAILALQRDTVAFMKEHYGEIITQGDEYCTTTRPVADCAGTHFGIMKNGYRVFTPKQIRPEWGASFEDRYRIGMKRETKNGKERVDAVIVETKKDSNDKRAGKIATLVGVSAGIFSSIDRDNAWGLNGIWKEKLEDYFGADIVSRMPSGIVVVSTAYEQEHPKAYLSHLEIDADLNMAGKDIKEVGKIETTKDASLIMGEDSKITLKKGSKICFMKEETVTENGTATTKEVEKCVEDWDNLAGQKECSANEDCEYGYYCESNVCQKSTDIDLIEKCNNGLTSACKLAFEKKLNRSCGQVEAAYRKAGMTPSTVYPNLTSDSAIYDGFARSDKQCGKCTNDEQCSSVNVGCIASGTEKGQCCTTLAGKQVIAKAGDSYTVTCGGYYKIRMAGGSAQPRDLRVHDNPIVKGGSLAAVKKLVEKDTIKTIEKLGHSCKSSGFIALGGTGYVLELNTSTSLAVNGATNYIRSLGFHSLWSTCYGYGGGTFDSNFGKTLADCEDQGFLACDVKGGSNEGNGYIKTTYCGSTVTSCGAY